MFKKKKFSPKKVWELKWGNISSTFKGNLETARDTTTIHPCFYYDGTNYNYVRFKGFEFTEVAHNRYSTQVVFEEV